MEAAPAPRAPDLVLASASPRRRELLERVGLSLVVAAADVDETPRPGERPTDYVRRVAGAKCDAVAATRAVAAPPLAVLAADTTVVVAGEILGKPVDADDAWRMLGRLAGRRHEVATGYRIRFADKMVERTVTTLVVLRALSPAELEAYVASDEWRGKAGGYAVQGIAGAFVTELRGSHTNVIGLPLAEVLADLQAMGALPGYPPGAFGAGP
ncbi:MAG TPA: Maf family protein [Polyangia bacterium]|nr:Maf family protein [Polyangia bacterium]